MSSDLLLTVIAETPVHIGVGQSDGAIDLPIAREGSTDIPLVPASGLKGALRERFCDEGDPKWKRIFGEGGDGNASGSGAGSVLFGDMRLLLLPVRSLSGMYRWVTSPILLKRLKRDRKRILGQNDGFTIPKVAEDQAYSADSPALFLEERRFNTFLLPENLAEGLARVTGLALADLSSRLAVVSDENLGWFCKHAIPFVARNYLEDGTKISKNLWYEEFLPADTVMTFALMARMPTNGSEVTDLGQALIDAGYVRVGGNETVGQGWFRLLKSGREEGADHGE